MYLLGNRCVCHRFKCCIGQLKLVRVVGQIPLARPNSPSEQSKPFISELSSGEEKLGGGEKTIA